MFLFKSKNIIVDCFTIVGAVAQSYPIKKSSYYTPEWWQTLNNVESFITQNGLTINLPTMKTCTGIVKLFKNSWTIPLWSDFKIKTSVDGTWNFATPTDMPEQLLSLQPIKDHQSYQYNHAFKKLIHLKFISPWLMYEKTGVNFLLMGADWTMFDKHPELKILSGILSFNLPVLSNINCFLPKQNAEFLLEAGTPLAYLIPITDRKVELKTHVLTEPEYRKIARTGRFYLNKFAYGVQKLRR